MKNKTDSIVWMLFAFLVVSCLWRSFLFAPTQLYDWDESIYSRVAWEMIDRGSLEMTYNGQVWLEKPPLVIYVLAAVTAIFGKSEVALRMTGVVSALALAWFLYLLGRKQLEDSLKTAKQSLLPIEKIVLPLLPVAFLFSAPVFIERTTMVNYDVPLALGWVLFFWAPTFPWRMAALLIGVLSKSLLGFYPLVIDVFIPRKKKMTWPSIREYLLLGSVPLVWHIIAFLIYGDVFIQQHLLDHLVRRVTSPIELHFGGRIYYFKELFKHYHVFILLPLAAFSWILVDSVRHFVKHRNLPPRYLIVYLSPLGYLAFLTFSQTKIWWYIIPALPFIGLSLIHLGTRLPHRVARIALMVLVFGFFLFQMITRVYLDRPTATISEKNTIAGCLKQQPNGSVAFLVEETERTTKNVMEAAQIQISTSFIYGGTPGFIYYSNRYPTFFYKATDFVKQKNNFRYVVLQKQDEKLVAGSDFKTICTSENWFAAENTL